MPPIPWPNGDDSRIEYLQENPKRAGSSAYELYEKYKKSKTLGEAKQNGARSIDIKFDYDKGFLKISENQSSPKASSSPKAASKPGSAKSSETPKAKAKADAVEKAMRRGAKSSGQGKADGPAADEKSTAKADAVEKSTAKVDAVEKSTASSARSSMEADTSKSSPGSAARSSRQPKAAAVGKLRLSTTSSEAEAKQVDIAGCWFLLPSMRANTVEFRDTSSDVQEESKNAKAEEDRAGNTKSKDGNGQAEGDLRRSAKGKDRRHAMLKLRSMMKEEKGKEHKKDKKDKKSKKHKKHKKEKKEKKEDAETQEKKEKKEGDRKSVV